MSELISFNLKERGRQFRGTPRNFDIPKIVECINGGVVQERVRHRDMLGYYGHWPRMVFGPEPREGGIIDGKVVKIDPALVTTYLKAYSDGTVEHRSEFLENDVGQAAERLKASKTGGWSAVINHKIPMFWGFDYVLEPNFTKNRAYELSLDSAGFGLELDEVTMDDVNAYYGGALEIVALLDGVNGENARLRRALLNTQHKVEELEVTLDRVSSRLETTHDSVEAYVRSQRRSGGDQMRSLFDRANDFARLPTAVRGTPETVKEDTPDRGKAKAFFNRLLGG